LTPERLIEGSKKPRCLRALLQSNIDIIATFRRVTPLRIAKVVDQAALRAQLWPNLRQVNRSVDALVAASRDRNVEAARLFIEHGVHVDDSCRGSTALHVSCSRAAQTSIWPRTKAARRSSFACQVGHVDVAGLLLRRGAHINKANNLGASPLFIACQNGHVESVRFLLTNGADVDQADDYGVSPLSTACEFGHLDVSRVLIEEHGADVSRACDVGASPLFVACQQKRVDVARLLLEKGADANQANINGTSPLYTACRRGCVDVVRLLLENGADVTEPNDGCSSRANLAMSPSRGSCSKSTGRMQIARRATATPRCTRPVGRGISRSRACWSATVPITVETTTVDADPSQSSRRPTPRSSSRPRTGSSEK